MQATVGFVASVLLLYTLWSSRTNNHLDEKKTQAPKVNGAWPILGHLPLLAFAGTDGYRTLGNVAEKYGPVFRIQLGLQNVLVVSSKEAVMQTSNDMSFMGRPEVLHSKEGFYGGFYALSSYGPYWQEMRKISNRELLSNTRVELLKPVRASEVTTCIKELYAFCCNDGIGGSANVDIGKWCQQVLFNMLAQVVARKRYSSTGKNDSDEELRCLKRAYRDFFDMLDNFKGIPFTGWMNFKGNWAKKKTDKEFNIILNSWIDDHMQQRGKQNHFNEDRDTIDVMISLFEESDGSFHGYNTNDVLKATIAVSFSSFGVISIT